jgi:hypothetical protein
MDIGWFVAQRYSLGPLAGRDDKPIATLQALGPKRCVRAGNTPYKV